MLGALIINISPCKKKMNTRSTMKINGIINKTLNLSTSLSDKQSDKQFGKHLSDICILQFDLESVYLTLVAGDAVLDRCKAFHVKSIIELIEKIPK